MIKCHYSKIGRKTTVMVYSDTSAAELRLWAEWKGVKPSLLRNQGGEHFRFKGKCPKLCKHLRVVDSVELAADISSLREKEFERIKANA